MKKLIAYLLAYLFLFIWGAGFLFPDAGYLLLSLGQKTVETSLWFTCFFLLTLSLIFWLLKKSFHWGVDLTDRLRDFFLFGSFERSSKRSVSGIVDFLIGDWGQARKKLIRSAPKSELPVVHYLVSVQSSIALGEKEQALKLLSDTEKKFPAYANATGLLRAKIDMQDGRYEQAKSLLRNLLQQYPQDSALLKLLCDLCVAQHNWTELNDWLSKARKNKSFSAQQLHQYEISVSVWQIRTASQHAKHLPEKQRAPALQSTWNEINVSLQRNQRVLLVYAQELVAHWQDNKAEVLIRDYLNKNWDDQLVNLYGMLRLDRIDTAVKNMETWLAGRPKNPILLRALGRLLLTQQAWHKARDCFKRSLEIQPTIETYAELARLQENLGEKQKAFDSYHAAIQLTVKALPDLPQPSHHRRTKAAD